MHVTDITQVWLVFSFSEQEILLGYVIVLVVVKLSVILFSKKMFYQQSDCNFASVCNVSGTEICKHVL